MPWAFDDGLVLDPVLYELRRGDRPVPLEPQAFDVLTYLVSHRDRVVSKQELMDAIWGGRFVTDAAVTSRIKQVRRALGDDGRDQRVIRTVHGRGYRFVGTLSAEDGEERESEVELRPAGMRNPTRYTVSDGLHIAYQVTGHGDTDIVLIPGFVSHLELDWADPRYAHFLDRLGRMGRLIRFDKRGTGMSDRPQGLPDLEARMHDVLAVMDATESRQAVLFGYSEGGPMAILMAATHPERVSSLVLYGSYAKRTRTADYPWGQTEAERRTHTDRLIGNWDWESDLLRRCPSGDAQMQRWWAQRVRAAATPSTIRALMDMNAAVDVRDVLAAVRVPTLVLHRRGDALFSVDEARYLSAHISSARLRLLEGNDHLPAADSDQILDEVENFLQTAGLAAAQPLALVAVVAVADDPASDMVDHLVGCGGVARTTPSGRRVVTFDGPATAVRSALGKAGSAARLGVSIAELSRETTTADGPGVRHAERIANAAGEGEVWVSAAAGMLLAGSGLSMRPVATEDDTVGRPLLRVSV
ncbi:MAG TPA: alpha/beta fold hydrolase [Acidothermaceae bacterium]|nr:alpha/beta fold hydrolase [Acidothermaceae bacterium]